MVNRAVILDALHLLHRGYWRHKEPQGERIPVQGIEWTHSSEEGRVASERHLTRLIVFCFVRQSPPTTISEADGSWVCYGSLL